MISRYRPVLVEVSSMTFQIRMMPNSDGAWVLHREVAELIVIVQKLTDAVSDLSEVLTAEQLNTLSKGAYDRNTLPVVDKILKGLMDDSSPK